jgi:hypothetical protein
VMQLAVARHLDLEPLRQRVDDRRAHAVQPAGRAVGAVGTSETMQRPSATILTRIDLQKPAIASSIELSTIS